jgi:hypothetical protein
MPIGVLNPADKDHSTAQRPVAPVGGAAQRRWYSDPLNTEIRDHDFNGIIAQIRHVIDHFAITDVEGDDTLLRQAIVKGTAALTGNVAALQAIIPGADKVPYWSSTSTASLTTFIASAYSRGLLANANLAAWQTALGMTAATKPNNIAFGNLVSAANTIAYFTSNTSGMALTPFTPVARQLLDDATFPAMRATLGLVGPYIDFTTLALLGNQPLVFNGGQVTSNTSIPVPTLVLTIKSGAATTGYIGMSAAPGGFDSSKGANIVLYGGTHATNAGDLALHSGSMPGAQILLNGVPISPFATSTNAANLTGTLPIAVIATASIPYTKLGVIASDRILGNVSGANASPIPLTAAQVRDMLDLSGSGDGTLAKIATTGSATDLSSGLIPAARYQVATIALSKLVVIPTDTILGNTNANPASPLALTVAEVRAMLGVTAGVTLAPIATSGSAAHLTSGFIPAARYQAATIPLAALHVIPADTMLGNTLTSPAAPVALTVTEIRAMLGIAAGSVPLAEIATSGDASDLIAGIIPAARYGTGSIALNKLVVLPVDTILGNTATTPAAPVALTVAQVKTMLGLDTLGGQLALIASSGSAADLIVGLIPANRYGAATIPLSKLVVISTDHILGNVSGNNLSPYPLTPTQVKTMLGIATPGAGLATIAVTGSAADLVTGTIPQARYGTGTIPLSKMVVIPTDHIIGNVSGGNLTAYPLTVAQVREMLNLGGATGPLAAIATSGSAADLVTGVINTSRYGTASIGYNKLALIAAHTILGNTTVNLGPPVALTVAEVKVMLGIDTAAGLAAIAASGSAADLIAGIIPAARYGTGTIAWTKLAIMPVDTLLGNTAANPAAPVALTVADVKLMLGIASLGSNLAVIATSGSATDLIAGIIPAARIGVGEIALNKITVISAATILGNNGAAAASPKALTVSEVKAMLGVTAGTVLAPIATSGSAADLTAGVIAAARFGVATIGLTKLQAIGADTILGNTTGASASPVALTVAEVRTMLNLGGSTGTLATIATSGSAADLIAGVVPAARLGAGTIALSKLVVIPTHTIIGNDGAAAAEPQALTVAEVKTMLGIATLGSNLAVIATSGSADDLVVGTIPAGRYAAGTIALSRLSVIAPNMLLGNAGTANASPAALTVAQVRTMLNLGGSTGTLAAIATSGSANDLIAGFIPGARFADHTILLAKLALIPPDTIVGNTLTVNAVPIPLTVAEVRTMLNLGGSTGQLAAIATSGSATDLVTGTINVLRIADRSLTVTKLAVMAANTILGNNTGAAVSPIALTVAEVKAMLGVTAGTTLAPIATSGSAAHLTTGVIPAARYGAATIPLTAMVVIAPATILGNNTAANAAPLALTAAAAKTLLGLAAIASSGDASHLIAGLLPAARFAVASIGFNKLVALPTLTLLGNNTAGTAPAQPLTVAQVKAMLGVTAGTTLAKIATSGSATDLITGTLPLATLPVNYIPFARMQYIAAARVMGNVTTVTGPCETVSLPQLSGAMGLKQFATSTDLVHATGTLSEARIANGSLILAKLVNIEADRLIGNNNASGGAAAAPKVLSSPQVAAMLKLGAWATSTDLVHATGTLSAARIATGSLVLAKLEPILADRMVGNYKTTTAVPEVLSKGQVIGWLNCVLKDATVITAVNSMQTNWFLALSTDPGAGASPAYVIRRTSASPAASDTLGYISFQGNNSALANVSYAEIMVTINSPTAAAHSSKMYLRTFNAAAATNVMTLGLGVQVGNPTGGDKGGGTLNAQVAVYDSGVVLNCMPMQKEFLAGAIGVDLDKWDKIAVAANGRKHEAAHHFAKLLKEGVDPRDPLKFIGKMKEMQALPGMPTEADWRHNELSVGEMVNRMWLAVEMLAVAWMTQVEKRETAQ